MYGRAEAWARTVLQLLRCRMHGSAFVTSVPADVGWGAQTKLAPLRVMHGRIRGAPMSTKTCKGAPACPSLPVRSSAGHPQLSPSARTSSLTHWPTGNSWSSTAPSLPMVFQSPHLSMSTHEVSARGLCLSYSHMHPLHSHPSIILLNAQGPTD